MTGRRLTPILFAAIAATAAPGLLSQQDPSGGAPTAAASVVDRAMKGAIDRASLQWIDHFDLYEDHREWDRAWESESAHYRVKTTHSMLLATQLCEDLEAMLGHFQTVLGTDYAPPERFTIYVYPNIDAYNEFGDQFGEDHSSYFGAFHSTSHPQRPVACMYLSNFQFLRMYVTHAATHQFVRAAFPATPPLWLDEAMASYFALYWNFDHGVEQVSGLQSSGTLFPLAELTRAAVDQYGTRTNDRFSQLGMLFSYLLWYREDTCSQRLESGEVVAGPFQTYVRDVLNGTPAAELDFHRWLLFDHRDEIDEAFRSFDFRS